MPKHTVSSHTHKNKETNMSDNSYVPLLARELAFQRAKKEEYADRLMECEKKLKSKQEHNDNLIKAIVARDEKIDRLSKSNYSLARQNASLKEQQIFLKLLNLNILNDMSRRAIKFLLSEEGKLAREVRFRDSSGNPIFIVASSEP